MRLDHRFPSYLRRDLHSPLGVNLRFENLRFFQRKSNRNQSFQINQTNSNLSACCIVPTSLSPHFIVQCSMMGCTQTAQVLRRIRTTFRQRHPMMHQRCLNVPTFCHAHLTERMPCQLRYTNLVPCSSVVSLLVRRGTEELVIVPVCFLPVLRAELTIRQIWTAGILAGLQWFSGYTPHLRAIEKPSQVLSCKGFVIWHFLGSFPPTAFASIIISYFARSIHIRRGTSRNIHLHFSFR